MFTCYWLITKIQYHKNIILSTIVTNSTFLSAYFSNQHSPLLFIYYNIKEMIVDLKELDIDVKIQSTINFLTNAINKKDSDKSEIWQAYSWLEYSILLVRLKKYNLLDNLPKNELKTNKMQKKKQPELYLIKARNLLWSLDYNDDEQILNSLRESRDLLKNFLNTKK